MVLVGCATELTGACVPVAAAAAGSFPATAAVGVVSLAGTCAAVGVPADPAADVEGTTVVAITGGEIGAVSPGEGLVVALVRVGAGWVPMSPLAGAGAFEAPHADTVITADSVNRNVRRVRAFGLDTSSA